MRESVFLKVSGQGDLRTHSLDGLRAVASLSIVVYHLALANFRFSGTNPLADAAGRLIRGLGSSGVELFFTLSAVVLLRPYLRFSRKMDVETYLRRRFTRLWPTFFGAWIIAGIVVAILSIRPTWWRSTMPQFSFSDWCAQIFIIYFGHNAYNFAWWTLSMEVMFYVIAPLLVTFTAKRSSSTMNATFFLSVLIAVAAGGRAAKGEIATLLITFASFASCFCGGLLLAKQDISRTARISLGATGVAIVGANVLGIPVNGRAGYGLIYMAIVSHVLMPNATSRALSSPVLIWFGERSYSLFLTHYSVIALACWASSLLIEHKGIAYFLVSRVLSIAGSLVVACILFELVEKRFAHGLVTAGMWLPPAKQRSIIPSEQQGLIRE